MIVLVHVGDVGKIIGSVVGKLRPAAFYFTEKLLGIFIIVGLEIGVAFAEFIFSVFLAVQVVGIYFIKPFYRFGKLFVF